MWSLIGAGTGTTLGGRIGGDGEGELSGAAEGADMGESAAAEKSVVTESGVAMAGDGGDGGAAVAE